MLRNLLNCHQQQGDYTRARLVETTLRSGERGSVPRDVPYPTTGDGSGAQRRPFAGDLRGLMASPQLEQLNSLPPHQQQQALAMLQQMLQQQLQVQ